MAVKKATTRADLTGSESPEELTASAVDPAPEREDLVGRVAEATASEMVADVKSVKTVKVKSPLGSVTEVPESIVDALLDSGYSKTK